MHKTITWILFMLVTALSVYGQERDSIQSVNLKEIVVVDDSYKRRSKLQTALSVEVVDKDFLSKHFTGNLVQALANIPGVRSMDIGSGFSKPMIRGMGFNRIAVVEHGIKQEGQQWGSDHGLEIDAFNIGHVSVRKGPSSLLFGSDAMGGVVAIEHVPAPYQNQLFGELTTLYKSVNDTWGGSLMLGVKKDAWHTRLRYSEQHFGDYRIPADTIIYLTQRIPIYKRKLKNTAGFERSINLYTELRKGSYYSSYMVSDVYQKTGFFPGAHGVPDVTRVQDDGNDRNIDLPNSSVNHLKVSSRQQYTWETLIGSWNVGYQNNHREEWSQFHTHYGTQSPPLVDPDKELSFSLDTYSSSIKLRNINLSNWEYTLGWDVQYQKNRVSGYSFLLPNYKRFTTGVYGVAAWEPSENLSLSGGLRYDFGRINSAAYSDPYLQRYLQDLGYGEDDVERNKWRSYPVKKKLGDFSGSVGLVWNPSTLHVFKANIGHSFRLPGANEWAANGVHHGTFRHEQGDPLLQSEKGWQLDFSYLYESERIYLSVSPFLSWFSNYIYLRPTGEWSILPHAGQIYRYTGAEVVFVGGELAFNLKLFSNLRYSLSAEYVYTYNQDEHTPLSYSPPASIRNIVSWEGDGFQIYGEVQHVFSQHRVDKNEPETPGANLINIGGNLKIPLGGQMAEINLSLRNLLNTTYYNHLSFYRKVEIPEPGRNIQLLIKIPFNTLLK